MIGDEVEFNELPFGKREKSLRLLKRSLRSIIDNNKNNLEWKEILDKIMAARRNKGRYRNEQSTIFKEKTDLERLNHLYELENVDQIIQKLTERYNQYNSWIIGIDKIISDLMSQLPKFMQDWIKTQWWG